MHFPVRLPYYKHSVFNVMLWTSHSQENTLRTHCLWQDTQVKASAVFISCSSSIADKVAELSVLPSPGNSLKTFDSQSIFSLAH